ncbi:stage V sporulation protein SpoVM [Clostridium sp. YIM B02565]|uniref:Stage V sporulation protein SpoVM n=1 Tax=Clostridium paridis TaxID=2803863 RepID=A0A937FCN9_9CLOT|nr:stage V sporulation protein SpoVM [Clostridium paridis]
MLGGKMKIVTIKLPKFLSKIVKIFYRRH